MDMNKTTQKVREAMQKAQVKTLRYGHQEVDAEHMLFALLEQEAEAFMPAKATTPVYGARPLKRFIQQYLETPLSRSIIAGEIFDGSNVEVSVKDGALDFSNR